MMHDEGHSRHSFSMFFFLFFCHMEWVEWALEQKKTQIRS